MVWTQLFSVVVIYNMLTVPLKFCFKEASLEYEKKTKILDYFLEIIWLLQILQMSTTVILPKTLTFKKIIKKYAKSGMLFLDVFATIPSLICMFMG